MLDSCLGQATLLVTVPSREGCITTWKPQQGLPTKPASAGSISGGPGPKVLRALRREVRKTAAEHPSERKTTHSAMCVRGRSRLRHSLPAQTPRPLPCVHSAGTPAAQLPRATSRSAPRQPELRTQGNSCWRSGRVLSCSEGHGAARRERMRCQLASTPLKPHQPLPPMPCTPSPPNLTGHMPPTPCFSFRPPRG